MPLLPSFCAFRNQVEGRLNKAQHLLQRVVRCLQRRKAERDIVVDAADLAAAAQQVLAQAIAGGIISGREHLLAAATRAAA